MTIYLKKCDVCGEVYDFEKCPFCRDKKLEEIKKRKGVKYGGK